MRYTLGPLNIYIVMQTNQPSYRQPEGYYSPRTTHPTVKVGSPSSTASSRNYLIVYAAENPCQVKADGRRYELLPGQFILINPGKEVQVCPADQSGIFQISLEPACLEHWRKKTSEDHARKVFPHSHGKLELCEQIYQVEDSSLGNALIALAKNQVQRPASQESYDWPDLLVGHQWQVYQQLQRLTSAKLSTRKELYRRLCKARRFMLDHLDSPLDLDTLAQVACLSKYHFIRLFKEVYGQTPRQYLISRRLERASDLLKESDLSFHEICHEVGLKDSSSFGRLFKRSFGATPHLYRRMHAVG